MAAWIALIWPLIQKILEHLSRPTTKLSTLEQNRLNVLLYRFSQIETAAAAKGLPKGGKRPAW